VRERGRKKRLAKESQEAAKNRKGGGEKRVEQGGGGKSEVRLRGSGLCKASQNTILNGDVRRETLAGGQVMKCCRREKGWERGPEESKEQGVSGRKSGAVKQVAAKEKKSNHGRERGEVGWLRHRKRTALGVGNYTTQREKERITTRPGGKTSEHPTSQERSIHHGLRKRGRTNGTTNAGRKWEKEMSDPREDQR